MAAMTMDRGSGGAEACPVPRFRRRDPRDWAVLAVAALHWAAVASAVGALVGAGRALWLG